MMLSYKTHPLVFIAFNIIVGRAFFSGNWVNELEALEGCLGLPLFADAPGDPSSQPIGCGLAKVICLEVFCSEQIPICGQDFELCRPCFG